jgi:hypothetical protein
MPYVLIQFKSSDPEQVMDDFLQGNVWRKRQEFKQGRLFRVVDDPDRFICILEWDEMDAAMKYASSSELGTILDRLEEPGQAGGIKHPRTLVLDELGWVASSARLLEE